MRKWKVWAGVFLLACALSACGEEEIPEGEPVQTVEGKPIESTTVVESSEVQESSEPEESVEETEPEEVYDPTVIHERVVVDGKMQSYLTGEWKDEAVARRRSMAVMIPNNKAAMPQYGISMASIIYEAPVEGRITRLMGFFEDYDGLDHIGPVRSSRDYYVYEAMAYDAIYCNWGLAVPFVEAVLASDLIDNISQAVVGIHNPSSEAFGRLDRPGYKTEYTGYLFIKGYNKAVERQGYEKEYRDSFVQAFTFAQDGYRAEYADKPSATKICPGGQSSNSSGYGSIKPYFQYNEEDGLYYRYQFGAAHKDDYNGEQLKVSNVVFKICEGQVREPIKNDYLYFNTHGTGECYVFTNGKVIKGTWRRDGNAEPNLFFDEDGNEIVFNQGKTWICNIWEDYKDCMTYE